MNDDQKHISPDDVDETLEFQELLQAFIIENLDVYDHEIVSLVTTTTGIMGIMRVYPDPCETKNALNSCLRAARGVIEKFEEN